MKTGSLRLKKMFIKGHIEKHNLKIPYRSFTISNLLKNGN